MKRHIIYILLILLLIPGMASARRSKSGVFSNANQNREFRGTWVQTAFQERYMRMSPPQCREYLTQLVDDLAATGFNAILFQIRPEGDAFYRSDIEPWSRFLTGKQGLAPVEEWDPMEYLIRLCHQRQIEFHAWINPYRMSASKSLVMSRNHVYHQHPEWFVRYDDKLYLNPAMPECRQYVRDVVKDIVSRYNIDALHIDDYFYPYPVKGKAFDDKAAYEAYAPMMNIDPSDPDALGKFRRRSVDILIKSLHEDIRSLKPWVRFGVSPFGIYRNAASWKGGSQTAGTQCYDDLYADVLFWAREGWIDYVIPQLYWEVGHTVADYTTLVRWWSDNVPSSCMLYIGQSIERSLDDPKDTKPTPDLRTSNRHLTAKFAQARACRNVSGNCFWYAYQVNENAYHVRDFLRQSVFQTHVLPPAYTHIDSRVPDKVQNLNIGLTSNGLRLSWRFFETQDPLQRPRFFCVYKFRKDEKVQPGDPRHLILRTTSTEFIDQDIATSSKYTYVVTAVDAVGNESAPVKK
ncbi:MAG: family 10 glycosylhydrolase, partial [Bacteroidales bacterium]|nr:family 10 glycosylhydrolase [Candidatus Liminaster caballi]